MSGICLFCISERKFTPDIQHKIYQVISSFCTSFKSDSDSQVLYFEKIIYVSGVKYEVRSDFYITYDDNDFELNYPEFSDSEFLKKNELTGMNFHFSISTMSRNPATTKIIINIINKIFSEINGLAILNHITSEQRSLLHDTIRDIQLTPQKTIYLVNSEGILRLNEIDERLIIE